MQHSVSKQCYVFVCVSMQSVNLGLLFFISVLVVELLLIWVWEILVN